MTPNWKIFFFFIMGWSLQKISEDFQQHLEDQLQGAIEACSQLDHVQKFITWALTHHCRGPVLFSRSLVCRPQQTLPVQLVQSQSREEAVGQLIRRCICRMHKCDRKTI